MRTMETEGNKKKLSVHEEVAIALFVALSIWWIILFFVLGARLTEQNLYWAATYQLLAWWGGIYALASSRAWGGFRSTMGRGIIFFGLGLVISSIFLADKKLIRLTL